jgi:AcrR family transcriptional regulator
MHRRAGVDGSEERGRRERRPQEKFARLVASATSVFTEQGYTRASVQEICRRACVSVGTFYSHFEDKADLLLHIGEELHARQGSTALSLAGLPQLEEQMRTLIVSSRAGIARAWIEASALDSRVKRAHLRMRRNSIRRYAGWIREARSARELRSRLDDVTAARAVIALLKEAVAHTSERTDARARDYANAMWLIIFGDDARHDRMTA